MLCQLSYEVKSVRVCGISELSLVPLIPMCSYDHDIFVCVLMLCTQVNMFLNSDVTLIVYPHRAG